MAECSISDGKACLGNDTLAVVDGFISTRGADPGSAGFYSKEGDTNASWELDLAAEEKIVGILVFFGTGLAYSKDVRAPLSSYFFGGKKKEY